MGVEWGSKNDSNIYIAAVVILTFCLFVLGYKYVQAVDLPRCEEDEYLYPVDYEGRGKNEASDYRCVHIDTIRSNG